MEANRPGYLPNAARICESTKPFSEFDQETIRHTSLLTTITGGTASPSNKNYTGKLPLNLHKASAQYIKPGSHWWDKHKHKHKRQANARAESVIYEPSRLCACVCLVFVLVLISSWTRLYTWTRQSQLSFLATPHNINIILWFLVAVLRSSDFQ